MIEQLPVHGDSAVGDMEAGDTPGGEGRTDDVLGQEGESHPALHHLAEQRGAAQLDVGMDRQPAGGEALVEGVTVAHAPLCEKKFLLSQNIQRHFGLVGQRMPGGGHEADRLRHIDGQRQAGQEQRLVEGVGQVDLVRAQQPQHLVGGGGAEHQLHLWAEGVELLQQVGQEGAAYGIGQCHPQGAADGPGRQQRGLGLLGRDEKGAGIALERLARVGEADGLAHPVKERRTQLCFQLGDLGRYRRLRVAQLPRSAGKAVQLGDMKESVDVSEFHNCPSGVSGGRCR